jgi:hypothetical protein
MEQVYRFSIPNGELSIYLVRNLDANLQAYDYSF